MSPHLNLKSLLAIVGCGLFSVSVQATVLQLAPVNYLTTATYNDFQVQSLDLNKKCTEANDPRCVPSGPYPVQSSPGQIADQAIILTSASGTQVQNFPSPFASGSSVDNPFLTPTGNQSSSFLMTSGNEPSNTFTGDQSGSWEINISALTGYLGQHDLVFLFDNNQQGTGFQQSLFVWGQVSIIDTSGNVQDCLEFSTGAGGCGSVPPSQAAFVPAIGNYCVSTLDGSAYNVGTATNQSSCTQNAGDYFVNDNLGTNSAEYVVFSSYLNDNLQKWADAGYLMSVDTRYFGNNAGAEQLWICSECDVSTNVPEPGMVGLLGLGLAGLAFSRRRQQRGMDS